MTRKQVKTSARKAHPSTKSKPISKPKQKEEQKKKAIKAKPEREHESESSQESQEEIEHKTKRTASSSNKKPDVAAKKAPSRPTRISARVQKKAEHSKPEVKSKLSNSSKPAPKLKPK